MLNVFKLTAILAALPSLLTADPLEKGERDRAMSYLHATRKQFADSVRGVSAEQAKWKAEPGRWSVAEVAEHIALSEDFLFQMVTGKLVKGAPATAEQKALTKGKDDLIPRVVPDRSQKFQAPEPIVPKGKFANLEDVKKAFLAWRDRTILFVEKTDISLRDYVAPHPAMKELDAYQWLLFLAAHSERHLKQLQEVKDNPGYPAH
ncbi:MAG TPA: DinB family protein [Bryobacteraceae bacterium]|jgi:DinB family protein|nr:DinB family protein [Bryobacteraceae bacterium]